MSKPEEQFPVRNLKVCEKVCKECPFSKNSPQGWLGGETVDETLFAQQNEHWFSCHLHRVDDMKENNRQIEAGEQPICRGFLVSAVKSFKMFGGNWYTGESYKRLVDSMNITDEEKEAVLSRQEFRDHHSGREKPSES